tara:strand:- start:3526 stop:3924 length:399 start_codon:yes stop_codon:yes gene_type:complete
VKIHHIGIVCKEKDIDKYFIKPKKKFVYNDRNQNNKLIIEHNPLNNLWMEFVIPKNNSSTVYNFLKKKGPGVHHFGYLVNDLTRQKKIMEKKGYFFVGSFSSNVGCFGGKIKTMFFFKNNFFTELLSNDKKK